jgi:hypothetical protein
VGAELDPREGRLETAEEVAIVLFWIPTVPPNLRHHTFGAELCQARKSPDMSFFFVLSFSSFISIIDSHPIPKQLIESFSLSYISLFSWFRDKEAGHEVQLMKFVFLEKVSPGFMGMERVMMNRGVYSVIMLSSPFFYQGKQIKPANNKALIFIGLK